MKWLMGHFTGEILQRHNVSRIDWPAGPYVYSEFNVCDLEGMPLPHTMSWSRELYIMNVEDANLATVEDCFVNNRWHTANGHSHSMKEFLLLRDPYNCFASIYRALGPFPFDAKEFPGGADLYVQRGSVIDIWKQHAREFLEPKLVPKAIHVDFSLWMHAQAYRREISRQFGRPFNDSQFGVRGMSSSFDGKFEDARKLKLFDRWRAFELDESFRKYFDDEIHDLAGLIFGESIKLPRDIFS